jgi:hypothetical protein
VLTVQHGNKAYNIFTSTFTSSATKRIQQDVHPGNKKKLRNTQQPLHLILQEGSKDGHSCVDIASIQGSDIPFFTIKYIKHGKRNVMAILSDD